MNLSKFNLADICFVAAIVACCIAAFMGFWAPDEVTHYVINGFTLPLLRYSLLFPLIACGFMLADQSPLSLTSSLLGTASTLCIGMIFADTLLSSEVRLNAFLLGYSLIAILMGLFAGLALLLPAALGRWPVPVACIANGLGLGISIGLDSPGDDYSFWFVAAGGLGGTAIVFISISLTSNMKQVGRGAWYPVVARILGSWLIAASLMLAALAVVPARVPDLPPPLSEPPRASD